MCRGESQKQLTDLGMTLQRRNPEPVKIFRADRGIQANNYRVKVCNLSHVSASKFDGQH
jgi:hypothetical protein